LLSILPNEIRGKPAMLAALDRFRKYVEDGEVEMLIVLSAHYTEEPGSEQNPNGSIIYRKNISFLDSIRFPELVQAGLMRIMTPEV
jgi:hypothetical protein